MSARFDPVSRAFLIARRVIAAAFTVAATSGAFAEETVPLKELLHSRLAQVDEIIALACSEGDLLGGLRLGHWWFRGVLGVRPHGYALGLGPLLALSRTKLGHATAPWRMMRR